MSANKVTEIYINYVKVTDNINKGQGQIHNKCLVPITAIRSECVATVALV